MLHHRVVDEREPKTLTVANTNWFRCIRILFAVERPHIALHVAGEMQLDLPFRRSLVVIRRETFQVGVDEDTPGALFESSARFVHPFWEYSATVWLPVPW